MKATDIPLRQAKRSADKETTRNFNGRSFKHPYIFSLRSGKRDQPESPICQMWIRYGWVQLLG
jgi:hypothetical protein